MRPGGRVNRRVVLARRPEGLVADEDFRIDEDPVRTPGPGEFLVRVTWLAFDPTQRNWLNDAPSYLPPVALGDVMRGFGAGEVVESNDPRHPVGMAVQGLFGWQDYVVTDGALELGRVSAIPTGVPPEKALGVFSTTGLTSYFGMLEVARVREGDVVLVSSAAGATGSVAGQVARIAGAARVIGIAGGERKCSWVRDVAGFDACIDHRSEDVRARLRELAPSGVDVYFDNVGGETLETAIDQLALHGRIALCGAISSGYDTSTPRHRLGNTFRLIERRGRMEGFLVLDFAPRFGEAVKNLAEWVRAGRIVTVEDVQHGLENAPATLRRLFEGRNFGKQLLRIDAG